MADKSEVIMEQMEDTRKDLADKVEKLEQKIAGTVETVSETVGAVTETVETVKEKIQDTVSTVTDTVQHTVEAVTEGVGNTVATVKESVKGFFNVRSHVDNHPWLMMGGSVLLGFLGGKLLGPRGGREESTPAASAAPPYIPTTPAPAAPSPTYVPTDDQSRGRAEERQEAEGDGWVSRLTDQFGGQLSHLKGLALGTMFGVLRDMVSQWVPESLKRDVTEVINGFTSNLGGQVIQGPVLGESAPEGQAAHRDEGQPTPAGETGGVSTGGRQEETETTARKGARSGVKGRR